MAGWHAELGGPACPHCGVVPPAEVREGARRYLAGLLDRVERKNGWQLAEHLGETGPQGLQPLLNARSGMWMWCGTTASAMWWSTWVRRRSVGDR